MKTRENANSASTSQRIDSLLGVREPIAARARPLRPVSTRYVSF